MPADPRVALVDRLRIHARFIRKIAEAYPSDYARHNPSLSAANDIEEAAALLSGPTAPAGKETEG